MTRATVYCVQAYTGTAARPAKGRLQQYGAAEDATARADELKDRAPGVLLFSVSGEGDCWEEPRVLARYGIAPAL